MHASRRLTWRASSRGAFPPHGLGVPSGRHAPIGASRRLALLSLATILVGGAAWGDDVAKPDYWFVGRNQDRTLFSFVDASTIVDDGAIRSAWITQIAAGKGIVQSGMRRKMTLTIFDCRHNTLFESRIVTYDQFAKPLMDHSYAVSRFDKIAPGSVESTERGFVCDDPAHWAAGKSWSRIIVTPEGMADNDNRAFENHPAP